MLPPAGGGGALKRFVERGGGVLVVAGERTAWPQGEAELLPGNARRAGRSDDAAAARTLGLPRLQPSGLRGVQGAAQRRLLRPRMSSAIARSQPTRASRVIARFDDGAVAAAERKRRAGPRHRLDVDARRLVDRPRREAGLPPARPPARCATSRGTSRRRRGSPSARSSTSPPRRHQTARDRIVVSPSGQRTQPARAKSPKGCWS